MRLVCKIAPAANHLNYRAAALQQHYSVLAWARTREDLPNAMALVPGSSTRSWASPCGTTTLLLQRNGPTAS
jgi:hypothetical protein